MYRLIQSSGFDRAFRRFARRHPELRERVAATFRLLSENPFEPSLRLHAPRAARVHRAPSHL